MPGPSLDPARLYAIGFCSPEWSGLPQALALALTSSSCGLLGEFPQLLHLPVGAVAQESPEFPYQACSQPWVLHILLAALTHLSMAHLTLSSHWQVL